MKNKKKIIILSILLVLICIGVVLLLTNKNSNMYIDEEDDDNQVVDVSSAEEVTSKKIYLSDYKTDIIIKNSGEYELYGEFKNTVFVNSTGDVTLNLNGIIIESSSTSAIANVGTGNLTIHLESETVSKLYDGGNSDYDGCIFSNGPLTISGYGDLYVYGNQKEGEGIATETNDITIESGNIYIESVDDGLNAGGDGGTITINGGTIYIKASGDGIDSNKNLIINGGSIYTMGSTTGGDAGIDTDTGYTINGGTVIALGSDMLESAESTSKQYSIAFNFGSTITKDTNITLVKDDGEVIATIVAYQDFKTLIISSSKLYTGTYYLYEGGTNTGELVNGIYVDGEYTKGEQITINGSNEFVIDSVSTVIGSNKRNQ